MPDVELNTRGADISDAVAALAAASASEAAALAKLVAHVEALRLGTRRTAESFGLKRTAHGAGTLITNTLTDWNLALAWGGTIIFGDGRYHVPETLIVKSYTALLGQGKSRTVLEMGASALPTSSPVSAAVGYLSNASTLAVGTTVIPVDTGTGAIGVGDRIGFPDNEDWRWYTVTVALSGGNVTIGGTGIRKSLPNNTPMVVLPAGATQWPTMIENVDAAAIPARICLAHMTLNGGWNKKEFIGATDQNFYFDAGISRMGHGIRIDGGIFGAAGGPTDPTLRAIDAPNPDVYHRLFDLAVINFAGDGIWLSGRGECQNGELEVYNCGRYGIRQACVDSFWTTGTVHNTGDSCVLSESGDNRWVEFKCWYGGLAKGSVEIAGGYGWEQRGAGTSGNVFVNCTSQDTYRPGVKLEGRHHQWLNFRADNPGGGRPETTSDLTYRAPNAGPHKNGRQGPGATDPVLTPTAVRTGVELGTAIGCLFIGTVTGREGSMFRPNLCQVTDTGADFNTIIFTSYEKDGESQATNAAVHPSATLTGTTGAVNTMKTRHNQVWLGMPGVGKLLLGKRTVAELASPTHSINNPDRRPSKWWTNDGREVVWDGTNWVAPTYAAVATPTLTLSALTLQRSTITITASGSTVQERDRYLRTDGVSAILGDLADSVLTMTDTAGGRFALSGTTVVLGATALTTGTYPITIRETNGSTTLDTTLSIVVN